MVTGLLVLRYAVFATVAVVALGALAAMAVQRRKLNPFGRTARLVRQLTDPALKPIERRLLRSGANPQSAPWLMLAAGVLGGIVVISGTEWVIGQGYILAAATRGGARAMLYLLVTWVFRIFYLALIVRVVGSWLGKDRYTTWMRPFYAMTEWFLAPLRAILPSVGPFDISPIVAILIMQVLLKLVTGIL